jgi:hypothetical protein
MTKDEIYARLRSLARSQGCRGRLLRDWEERGCTEECLQELEDMNFQSPLELILFLEGN